MSSGVDKLIQQTKTKGLTAFGNKELMSVRKGPTAK